MDEDDGVHQLKYNFFCVMFSEYFSCVWFCQLELQTFLILVLKYHPRESLRLLHFQKIYHKRPFQAAERLDFLLHE